MREIGSEGPGGSRPWKGEAGDGRGDGTFRLARGTCETGQTGRGFEDADAREDAQWQPEDVEAFSLPWDIEEFRIPPMEEAHGPAEVSLTSEAATRREVNAGEGDAARAGELSAEARDLDAEARDLERLRGVVDGVNPRFDPFRENEFSRNCGACARATELRFTGRDPEAVAGAQNIASVVEMELLTGRVQVPLEPSEIRAWAETQPPGFITVMGMDFRSGNGHWVDLARTETGVYVLDGQCGRVWPFHEYLDLMGPYVSRWDIGIERDGDAVGRERAA